MRNARRHVSAANKGRSAVIYLQSFAFDRPYLLCNDHCDRWLYQEIFFLLFSEAGVIENCAIHRKTSMLKSLFNFISTSSQKGLQHRLFLWKLWNFYEQLFLWNTSGGCSCQFDKVTVQWWTSASANLLFLIKNKICGIVSTKKVCRSLRVCYLLIISSKHFNTFID